MSLLHHDLRGVSIPVPKKAGDSRVLGEAAVKPRLGRSLALPRRGNYPGQTLPRVKTRAELSSASQPRQTPFHVTKACSSKSDRGGYWWVHAVWSKRAGSPGSG